MKIILLNGPPGSGKDTVAETIEILCATTGLASRYRAIREKFARPLKEAAPMLYGISQFAFDEMDNQGIKDEPHDTLLGYTPRRVQQEISERLLKPMHGADVFGRLFCNRVEGTSEGVVIPVSDCGFAEEARAVVDHFGKNRVELWHILRKGCSYDGDTRDYVDPHDVGLDRAYEIHNKYGDWDDLNEQVKMQLKAALGEI